MTYKYSQEAKERISRLGQSAVIEFIEEVFPASRRSVYSIMPRVQGFRSGHAAEFKEKQKRLIGQMFQTNSSPEEVNAWKGFSLLWKFWAEEHIGKPFPSSSDSKTLTDSGTAFFGKLADTFPKVAREDIERLFIFSGFADDSKITEAFGLFRPATLLARDNVVDALPIRLGELAERIDAVGMTVVDTGKSIKRLESTTSLLSVELNKSIRDTSLNLNLITELQNLLSVQTKRSDTLMTAINELYVFRKVSNGIIDALKSKIDVCELGINEFSLRDKILNNLAEEVSELQGALHAICVKENEKANLIDENGHNELVEKINYLESRIIENDSSQTTGKYTGFYENKSLFPCEKILSHDDAFNMIASNLQAVGLTKSSSFIVARLTLAAFISGQIVQFCGSLADIVADAVATAVGYSNYHEWRVPVGLVSDEIAFDFIESKAKSSHCLVLRGANLSAFEIYGTAIRDIVVQRQLYKTSYDHLALIATWKQGPAVFPDGGMLTELGPVINTDTLKMRGVSANLPVLNYGCLAQGKWAEIEGLKSDIIGENMDELKYLLDETGFDGGILWRRMINNFYTSLMKIPGGNYIYDLHSVLFFYTLPWAKAKGGPVKEIADIAARELKEFSDKMSV
ncbi:hypothetical protein [Yersinia enterocolitica]|uniref:hypothetical protein n=1 Tax=Yersinia enterocolitica TaxID=630 RepID=UPI0002E72C7B|nr:hypothetical protein [Yersinia enterocolitica]